MNKIVKPDPFYPIFDSVEWLERLVPLGIKLLQLRIKDKHAVNLKQQIEQAKILCDQHGCQLIVNDYWQLAIELGCDYIHLGQEDLKDADIAAIRSAGIRIGVSTHAEAELSTALAIAPDYVALGPVYPTILKKMPWAAQGLDRVSRWKKALGDVPLIAIGGMSVERATGVLDAGADVVSVVTDITLNEDPEGRVKSWLDITEPYRN